MLTFLKSLFAPKKRGNPQKNRPGSKPSGKVAILPAGEKSSREPDLMHTMEAVTPVPTWYLEHGSFTGVQFTFPSEGMQPPVIQPEDRELLKRYVKDVCPEPDSSLAIYQKLNNPDASVKEVSALVASDPMLAAQILKLVNSAAFGISTEVTSVGRAVTLLGFQNVKSVVLNHSIRRGVNNVEAELSHRIREHSVMCSAAAYHIAESTPGVDRFTVSTLAILHDMGKLLSPMIAKQGKGLKLSMSVPNQVVEALVASVFAELWQLPQTIVSSLECTHHPYFYSLGSVPADIRKGVTVLSMANIIANAMGYPDGDNLYPVKTEFLDEIRQVDSPARWIDGALAVRIEQFRGVLK